MKIQMILTSIIAMMLLATAVSAQTLTIQRPKMREITISFTSDSGWGVSCDVYQRIFWFMPYEYAKNFTLNSGENLTINMDNMSPIYRDLNFLCSSGTENITVNSVYVVTGITLTSTETVTSYVTTTETLAPLTSTTTITTPVTVSVTSTSTITHTTTHTTTVTNYCLKNGDFCSKDSQCCSGDCHGSSCHS